MAIDIPVVMTSAGAQPTAPAVIRADLVALVSATNPGYTANLPASLIEDVSSTEVAGISLIDQARVDTINSLTPIGANDFLLLEQGQLFIGPGAAPGVPTNTSVSVVFTALDPNTLLPLTGQLVPMGFVVSDGTYQYVVQDDGVTNTSGNTPPLFCLATIAGSWAVPSGTVTQLITSAPVGVNLTCSNPLPGTPGNPNAETAQAFRTRVMQAAQSVSTGLQTILKTALATISGVQQRLIAVRQQGTGWEVIVGGGDQYLIAQAIYDSGLNIAGLVGSSMNVTNITSANPGVVTTDKNHGYTTGQTVTMTGIVGPTSLNGVPETVTVLSGKTFSIPVNTSILPAYVSGGVCSPNSRNMTPNISDQPDVYTIPFVSPPQQTVTIAVSWNTTQPNFASQASVAQLASAAIAAYVNSIPVGAPISVAILTETFVDAVASVLDPETISVLTFAVSINGVSTPPVGQLITGDPESYFFSVISGIAVTQA